jgi:hypothetical protein
MKEGTYQTIREFAPHIICFQEIRKEVQSTPSYNFVCKTRPPTEEQ